MVADKIDSLNLIDLIDSRLPVKIAKYGVTKLFTEISFHIGHSRHLLGRSIHIDTTTLTLHGSYENNEELFSDPPQTPKPMHGYSKSGRHDLKQMILLLATTGASHFPIWLEAHSGNASDKKTLPKAASKIQTLCQSLANTPEFIYVGDSAIYSNILEHSANLHWITRIPETIKEARGLVSSVTSDNFIKLDNGYAFYSIQSNYGDVQQRWILFFSEAAYAREIKTLDKK